MTCNDDMLLALNDWSLLYARLMLLLTHVGCVGVIFLGVWRQFRRVGRFALLKCGSTAAGCWLMLWGMLLLHDSRSQLMQMASIAGILCQPMCLLALMRPLRFKWAWIILTTAVVLNCGVSVLVVAPFRVVNDPLSDAEEAVLLEKCHELFYVDELQKWAIQELEAGTPLGVVPLPLNLYRNPNDSKVWKNRAEIVETPGKLAGDPNVQKATVQRWLYIRLFQGKVQDYHGHVDDSENGLLFGPTNAPSPYIPSSIPPASPGIFSWPIIYHCA